VIANGGMLVKPRLILKRGDKPEPVEAPVRVIKPETAITMRQMMEGVVLRGTGRCMRGWNGYTSAGKTGTAQIFDSETHHYSHNYNASFLGFAPVTNPALVVLVTVHNTSGENGQGADAAAPVFRDHDGSAAHAGCAEGYSGEEARVRQTGRRKSRASSRRSGDRGSGRPQHHGRRPERAAVAGRADEAGKRSGRNSAGAELHWHRQGPRIWSGSRAGWRWSSGTGCPGRSRAAGAGQPARTKSAARGAGFPRQIDARCGGRILGQWNRSDDGRQRSGAGAGAAAGQPLRQGEQIRIVFTR
jgi:hypothetical protein